MRELFRLKVEINSNYSDGYTIQSNIIRRDRLKNKLSKLKNKEETFPFEDWD